MILTLACILFALGLAIAASVTDFRSMTIPNIIPATLMGVFVLAYIFDQTLSQTHLFHSATSHGLTFLITLIVMIGLFFAGLFGGGDAKMIAAVALWTGIEGLPAFLMMTSLCGAALAVIGLVLQKTKTGQKILTHLKNTITTQPNGWIAALHDGKNKIPYGIAIAIGTLAGFRAAGYLP